MTDRGSSVENQGSRNKEDMYPYVRSGGDVEATLLSAARQQKRFTPFCEKSCCLAAFEVAKRSG